PEVSGGEFGAEGPEQFRIVVDRARALRRSEPDDRLNEAARGKHVAEKATHRMADDERLAVELADFAGEVGEVVGEAGRRERLAGAVVQRRMVMAKRGNDDA